ncbi:PREDICTED: cortexin-1 isoform X3 [Corvus brachyrhynchos]|uniref:cortexin-1 isoform X3 n=1 Tax=Corvus brachyrhynchos TaxID=85066 RepID=UPI0008166B4A|nr:PREDICTED: cortexin-1 isoform X3 [Corvus brachyrhynchos]
MVFLAKGRGGSRICLVAWAAQPRLLLAMPRPLGEALFFLEKAWEAALERVRDLSPRLRCQEGKGQSPGQPDPGEAPSVTGLSGHSLAPLLSPRSCSQELWARAGADPEPVAME